MRYFLALAGMALTLALISGCDLSQRITALRTFGAHPVVDRSSSMDSTQQDMLNIQAPTKITAIRGGTAQCFDYVLARDGKKRITLCRSPRRVGLTPGDIQPAAQRWQTAALHPMRASTESLSVDGV